MRVRAIRKGYAYDHIAEEGEEFELREGDKLGSWMEEVKAEEEPPRRRERKAHAEGGD